MNKSLSSDCYFQYYKSRVEYYKDYYKRNRERILAKSRDQYRQFNTQNSPSFNEYVNLRKQQLGDGKIIVSFD